MNANTTARDLLLYRDPVEIIDPKNFNELVPNSSSFLLFFSSNLGSSESRSVFDKKASISNLRAFEKSKNEIHLLNLALPRTTSLKSFEFIIAYLLHVHVSCLSLKNASTHIELDQPTFTDDYLSRASLGWSRFKIEISPSSNLRENNYDAEFKKPLEEALAYISNLSNSPWLVPTPYIYSFSIVAIPKKKSLINIAKLFNLNHVTDNWAERVYICSSRLKEFMQSNNLFHYVRSKKGILKSFSDINSRVNAFAVVIDEEVDQFVHLYQLSVIENGSIELLFNNLEYSIDYDSIIEKSLDWISSNFSRLLEKINLAECIYDIDFSPSVKSYSLIRSTFSAYTCVSSNSSDLATLGGYPGISVVYKMKTTARYTGISINSDSLIERFNYIYSGGFLLSDSVIYNLLQTSYLLIREHKSSLFRVWFYNLSNYDHFKILATLALAGLSQVRDELPKDAKSLLEAIETRRKSRDTRMELTSLTSTDPVLFGSRTVRGSVYEYSQYVQKPDMRPTIITLDEYEKLKNDFSQSVIDLRNQTNGKRLYLACPSPEFYFLNFHYFNGQSCFVRCTKRISNIIQLTHCATTLDARISDKYTSRRGITNPISFDSSLTTEFYLPPIELADVLTRAICKRLDIQNFQELATYVSSEFNDLLPFVIERNTSDQKYLIRSEYDPLKKYALVILNSKNTFFICIDTIDNWPIVIDQNLINSIPFIHRITHSSNVNFYVEKFITYISLLLKHNFKLNASVSSFLGDLAKNYNLNFIGNEREEIIGVVLNKKVFLTPRIFNPGLKTKSLLDLCASVNNFPNFSSLDQSGVSKLYFAYPSHRVIMVKYYGTTTLVRPFKTNSKGRLVDFFAYALYLVGGNITRIPGNDKLTDISDGINDIYMSYLMILDYKNIDFSFEKLEEFMKPILVQSEKTSIVYLDNDQSIVSWRKSRINIRDFKHFISKIDLSDKIHQIRLINEKLSRDMDFTFVEGEQINRLD